MLPEAGALAPEAFAEAIASRREAYGLALSPDQISRLSQFLAKLDSARRRTNLTGPLPSLELVEHALESAMGLGLLPQGASLLDIGTGGGFPGLPLAIARPDLRITLLEPRPLRTAFLRDVTSRIGLSHVEVLEGKLPALAGRTFQTATSRAVGDLARLVGDAPFLEPGGLLLAWTTDAKGLASQLSGRFHLEASRPVPDSDRKVIVLLRKLSAEAER